MQIKIGFTQNSRELVITSEAEQDAVLPQIREFLGSENPRQVLQLEGAKGSQFLVLREQVAYVEVGSSAKNAVGFL